jgi:glycosyltransferase involved in cell wall biosynthesis
MPDNLTVLHYVSAEDDRGGVISVIRAVASTDRFRCILGVNPGFRQSRPQPQLDTLVLPAIAGERLGLRTFWRARGVARLVRNWLDQEPGRIFHGHSRAGLAVALWLARAGETRAVATVHSYGRQRWFYRAAARRLGQRIFWLTPAMKRYYGVGDGWDQCMPGCLPAAELDQPMPQRNRGRRPIRFGGAGLIVPWKGWHLMIDALAALPATVRSELRFVHIGSTADTAESKRYAAGLRADTAAHELENLVEWRGEQHSSAGLLAETDCAVVLSDHEPFSMVMLEALAAGVPVLASNAGGPADVLQPGVNGWFFESGNASSLAAALQLLVTTDALARARVERDQLVRFRADVVAEQWRNIYDRVARGVG